MKRIVVNIVCALSLFLVCVACNGRNVNSGNNRSIVVTIPPLQGLVQEIVGDDYEVVCLLPMGASPETYSPTARQISMLADAEAVFTIGTLTFEQEIIQRIKNQNDNIVTTAKGIELLTGCGHHHAVDGQDEHHAHNHHHSFDPHVWLAPNELGVIVDNIAHEIITQNPDSVKYVANYEQLKAKLEQRSKTYREVLINATRAFLIYHPALGYFAKEYDLEQISLENEGKSPTPAALADVVDRVEREGLRAMFYQQEYPLDVVKPIAEILGVNLVQINPLSSDIIGELDNIVTRLTNSNE